MRCQLRSSCVVYAARRAYAQRQCAEKLLGEKDVKNVAGNEGYALYGGDAHSLRVALLYTRWHDWHLARHAG